jgi:isopentenyl-diphosphate delta-isomerase
MSDRFDPAAAGGAGVSSRSEQVILVDHQDTPIGIEEKGRAHAEARLHRAFSVFVFDDAGRMLLQRRALTKYHSAGLWSNTCCSHPRPGESTMGAAHRRLREEMGFDCPLQTAFSFVYRVDLGGIHEHEYDHVFLGRFHGVPRPDPAEVEEWCWLEVSQARGELASRPGAFSYWFRIAFDELEARGLLGPTGNRWLCSPTTRSQSHQP